MSAKDTQVGGSHYKDMAIQPIEFILANGINFCEANVIKYCCRWRSKGGVDDLRKARHYLDLLIESETPKPSETYVSGWKDPRLHPELISPSKIGAETVGDATDRFLSALKSTNQE